MGKLLKYFSVFLVALVFLLFFNAGNLPASNDGPVSDFITRFYQLCLDRQPDQQGLEEWTTRLLSGKATGADVAYGFVNSQEFAGRSTSDEQFLQIMYKAFFNRDPDQAGFDKWLSLMRAGNSRTFVLAGFINSQEFKDLCSSYGIRPGSLDHRESAKTPVIIPTTEIPIIALHGIEPEPHGRYEISAGGFEYLVSTLKQMGYQTITLNDLLWYFDSGRPLPPKPVIITSDDGYQSMYKYAFPILKKYGAKMTVFLITSYIGDDENSRRMNEFDTGIYNIPDRPMLIWPEVAEMSRYGCEFQSHTWSHGIIRNMPIESSLKELVQSKHDIEVHTGRTVSFVSWPHSATSDKVIALLGPAGYRGAVYAGGGVENLNSMNILGINRIPLLGPIPPEAYAEHLGLK